MKLQKIPQGLKITSDFLLKPYVVLGGVSFLGMPMALLHESNIGQIVGLIAPDISHRA